MNQPDLFESHAGFALRSEAVYIAPSQARREAELAAECAQSEPAQLKRAPIYRLTPAELAAIDRNLARVSKFSDRTGDMF